MSDLLQLSDKEFKLLHRKYEALLDKLFPVDVSKIEIPAEVVEKEQYLNLIRYRENPLFHDKRFITTSIGTTVDLRKVTNQIKSAIETLPELEAHRIMELKKIYVKAHNKTLSYQFKAFARGAKIANRVKAEILETKKAEVLELFGRMFSIDEVHQIITQEWKFYVSKKLLEQFRKKHNEVILEKIEMFRESYLDMRLSSKRGRLEELTELYNDRKHRYLDTRSGGDYQLLLRTIEVIRKEVEGEVINVKGDLQIQHVITKHIKTEIFKTIPIKEIVLAKVASRANIPVLMLVKSLNDSYYKDYSDVLGDLSEEKADPSKIIYPSSKPIDLDKIRKLHEKLDEQFQEAEIITDEPKMNQITRDNVAIAKSELKTSLKAKKSVLLDTVMDLNKQTYNRNNTKTKRKSIYPDEELEAKQALKRKKEKKAQRLRDKKKKEIEEKRLKKLETNPKVKIKLKLPKK